MLLQKIILLTTDYITGIEYEGCVLFLGGDLFSGDIHEELSETNEDTILSSVIFWTEQLAAGINLLADHFNYTRLDLVTAYFIIL